jgi:hypothetical protein
MAAACKAVVLRGVEVQVLPDASKSKAGVGRMKRIAIQVEQSSFHPSAFILASEPVAQRI